MDHESGDLKEWVSATTIAVTVLALIAVCLRLLARFERKQQLWWDDWMIMWSMGWNIIVVGFIFAMIQQGMGHHADTIPVENVVLMAKYLVVAEILYVFNLVWTKLSILLMYYRIFRFPFFKRWAYIIGTFVILWVICITFLFIFICVPVEKLWYPDTPGRCINQVATWIANSVSTILSDLAILLLPLPQVWRLQLRLSEKLALTFAFSLGFFVVFASAYRLTVLFSYTAADSSYTLAPTVGWTAIEMSAGIVSACLPTLRPALQLAARALGIQRFMPALLQSRSETAAKSSGTDPSHNASTVDDGAAGARDRHSFYQLPGETESDKYHGVTQRELDSSLRPEYDQGQLVTNLGYAREEPPVKQIVSLNGIQDRLTLDTHIPVVEGLTRGRSPWSFKLALFEEDHMVLLEPAVNTAPTMQAICQREAQRVWIMFQNHTISRLIAHCARAKDITVAVMNMTLGEGETSEELSQRAGDLRRRQMGEDRFPLYFRDFRDLGNVVCIVSPTSKVSPPGASQGSPQATWRPADATEDSEDQAVQVDAVYTAGHGPAHDHERE
ncbi:hypothetical protein FE257_011218 [Aspergillus nanangensis]|uniref:Rhodopsin domain-containing protein n=1 Tax=Aspergillus nanangensis TaxID=2582783 RepID=A0AAD4CHR2_ASPNN|nr:hypothetical protein FE257_011218 [Aspergillus nanangensis]